MSCCDNNTPTPPTPTPPPQPVAQCPGSVSITPGTLRLCNTASGTLTANGTPAGGTFSWTSSNTAAATVSGSGATATVTNVAAGTSTITVTYRPPGCPPCTAQATVTTCKCTPGRKYAYSMKQIANLTGAKTKIKTRYGKLCCEGCASVDAFHAVYVNISNSSSGTKWAQVGFSRRRNAGSTSVIQYRKAEIQGNAYNINMDTASAPAEGAVHAWKIELDKATGTWTYYDDGTSFQTYTDAFWASAMGTDVNWTGEIYNKEDDMPGTDANKCSFTECQYRVDGAGYVDGIDSITNNDSSEWGATRVSASALDIWDKKPNP